MKYRNYGLRSAQRLNPPPHPPPPPSRRYVSLVLCVASSRHGTTTTHTGAIHELLGAEAGFQTFPIF